jgi:hypothetical protein
LGAAWGPLLLHQAELAAVKDRQRPIEFITPIDQDCGFRLGNEKPPGVAALGAFG